MVLFKFINLMKILYFFLTCIISINTYSQKGLEKINKYDYQFDYRYDYIKDTLNLNDKRSDFFSLYVDKQNNSYFLQNKLLEIDSLLLEVEKNNQIVTLPSSYSKWRVIKNNDKGHYFIDMLGKNYYNYLINNDFNINWQIKDEHKEILGYKATKAVCKTFGREWEVWFTEQIPLSSGPYKFSGLPGLIMEISDTKKYFTFELLSVKSKSKTIELPSRVLNSILLTKEDFEKALRNYNENIIEELKLQGIHLNSKTQEVVIENIKRNNNFLEKK